MIDYLELPLVGKTGCSHPWEMIAIYKTACTDEKKIKELTSKFKKQGEILLNGEIF